MCPSVCVCVSHAHVCLYSLHACVYTYGLHVGPCSTYTFIVTFFLREYANTSYFEWSKNSTFAHLANHSPYFLYPKEMQGAWSPNSAKGKCYLCNTALHKLCLNTEDILDMLSNYQMLFMLQGVACVWIIYPQPLSFLVTPSDLLDFNIWANSCPWHNLIFLWF